MLWGGGGGRRGTWRRLRAGADCSLLGPEPRVGSGGPRGRLPRGAPRTLPGSWGGAAGGPGPIPILVPSAGAAGLGGPGGASRRSRAVTSALPPLPAPPGGLAPRRRPCVLGTNTCCGRRAAGPAGTGPAEHGHAAPRPARAPRRPPRASSSALSSGERPRGGPQREGGVGVVGEGVLGGIWGCGEGVGGL